MHETLSCGDSFQHRVQMLQKHDCRNADYSQIEWKKEDWQFKSIREDCATHVSFYDENEDIYDDWVNVKENVLD